MGKLILKLTREETEEIWLALIERKQKTEKLRDETLAHWDKEPLGQQIEYLRKLIEKVHGIFFSRPGEHQGPMYE